MSKDIEKSENNVISLLTYKKLNPLFSSLSGKKYAIIKGEPLSLLAYGDVGNRTTNDLDILIRKTDLTDIESTLINHGYFSKWSNADKATQRENRILCLSSSHQVAPFKDKSQMISIDLNFDIFWGEYTGKRVDISEFLSDTIEIEVYGCKIMTLPPLKAMIQLILHHYKDMNSIFLLATRKSIKYEMFQDVYFLLKNNLDTITLENLYSQSEQYNIIPYVYFILYHTQLLFNDDILKRYVEAFKTNEGEMIINCYGLNKAERREWSVDFKTRLESDNIYEIIKAELNPKDLEKIEINRKVFMGG